MSGHYYAATTAAQEAFQITVSSGLAWFGSSEALCRGFNRVCGSSLFFDHDPSEPIGIATGSLDGQPALKLAAYIYVDEAGDYYHIDDSVEQFDT